MDFFQNQDVARKRTGLLVFLFILAVILMILILVWTVTLMYRAYSVSCNVRGGKAIGTFIVGLLLAEISSKFAIYALLKL